MKKKRYEGELKKMAAFEIYLNVSHLEKGNYVIHLVIENKIVKTITFKKKTKAP